jgi:hypothetical protein
MCNQAEEEDVLLSMRELPNQPEGDFFARAIYR